MLTSHRIQQFIAFERKTRIFQLSAEEQYFLDLIKFFKEGGDKPSYSSSHMGYTTYQLDDIVGLLNPLPIWDEVDDRILSFLTEKNIWSNIRYYSRLYRFLNKLFEEESSHNNIYLFWSKLEASGISKIDFVNDLLTPSWENYTQNLFLNNFVVENVLAEPEKIVKSGNMMLLKYLVDYEINHKNTSSVVDLFLDDIFEESDVKSKYFFHEIRAFSFLLRSDLKYEIFIIKRLEKQKNFYSKLLLIKLLEYHFPGKYSHLIFDIIHQLLISERTIKEISFGINSYDFSEEYQYSLFKSIPFIDKSAEYLSDFLDKYDNLEMIKKLFFTKHFVGIDVLQVIIEKYGEESVEIIVQLINNLIEWTLDDYRIKALKSYLTILTTFKISTYKNIYINYLSHNSKKLRDIMAVSYSSFGEYAIEEAENLLRHKKADLRQTGALLLSLIKSEKAQEILTNFIDTEKNDDTRDTMLEGILTIIANQNTREDILHRVQKAKERGKLETPLEKWLDESKLPPIYWKDSNQIIDNDTLRFLFYRMGRAKDIRMDIEAKALIMLIDRALSGAFAKGLVKAYFENGAEAKYKFCLTLGGLLGDDDVINLLRQKVIEFAETSRGKMAEYTVKSLALQGSTKALRAVEFFSRKYKAKHKNIGAAANESFIIVAEELGISPYDLADSIIPNFGFDGLFRRFEIGDESYRAFINTDFKIMFLNEDNKLLKSPPKDINKELAEELKEISKEIKDIVKSQSNRLEQYLIIQRKWSSEKWQSFFLENPIMFVYAVRLIWGAYNSSGELLFTFRCEQDQTLINEEGDEIALLPTLQIGMVHPISLSSQSIDFWSSSLYDANLQPIFPQLNRMVVSLKEQDCSLKMSEEFSDVAIGGYAFVNKMDKLGWVRGSVVDAGGISSYYKDFSEAGITAIIIQKGMISVGYLEENAELGSLMFVHKGKVAFGSYVYDEPENIHDTRLIDFGNVPPIVYSEVMADMISLKAIQVQS